MTRYRVVYVCHVTLKVAAAGEGVAVVQVVAPKAEAVAPKVEAVAPKAEAGVDPAESGWERRQVQQPSRIDDRVG
jgi:hypothetical protein